MGVDAVGARALAKLQDEGCEVIHAANYGPLTEAELLPQLSGIDAVMAGMDHFTAAVLGSPQAAGLKIISRWGVGIDAVDLAAATQRGIIVTNTPGMLNEAVADFTMALLLGVVRQVAEGCISMREGRWEPTWGPDLSGKTLGLIGCGGIGQAVAKRARGFDMRLLGSTPNPSEDARQLGIEFAPLEQVLAESDFVSLHCALTAETHGLIGEHELRAMKPGAFLINTARGAIVDEAALACALEERWIAGAALDVFANEPLPADHPFRAAPNLLMTPHVASLGYESGARVSLAAAEAILDARAARCPRRVANPDVIQSTALRLPLASSPPSDRQA